MDSHSQTRTWWQDVISLDLRSLALFRMGLGAVLLWDLAIRATALTAHYTDQGMFSLDQFVHETPGRWVFSLHALSGTTEFQAVLFVIAALFAFCLMIGCWTRVAVVVSWVLLLSLHNRNPLVLNAADPMFRVLMFWAMFLPLGARWSVDALLSEKRIQVSSVFSVRTMAMILQICFVYWFTVLLKTGSDWWDGSALYYVFQRELLLTAWGRACVDWTNWYAPMTYAVIIWEVIGTLFLILGGGWRMISILGFLAFHGGIAILMNVGLFPAVAIVAWLVLLPTVFWERLAIWFPRCRQSMQSLGLKVSQIVRVSNKVKWELKESSITGSVAVGICLLVVFVYNIQGLYEDSNDRYQSQHVENFVKVLRLDQRWSMFSPNPSRNDGWFVCWAKLSNGDTVDLFSREKFTWQKPENVREHIPNRRWGKIMFKMLDPSRMEMRRRYLALVVDEWNTTHGREEQVRSYAFRFVLEVSEKDRIASRQLIDLWTAGVDQPSDLPMKTDPFLLMSGN
jgi:hypothetical protein